MEDRHLLYSMQPLKEVADSFQDEDFKKNVKFIALPILEAFVNAVVEEITQRPPRTELRATDPTAISEKEKDIELLKKRKILERDISHQRRQVGEPPYKMPYDKFSGNAQVFDEMGLDENDPEDINFYVENFQRLLYEIAGQAECARGQRRVGDALETTAQPEVADLLRELVPADDALAARGREDRPLHRRELALRNDGEVRELRDLGSIRLDHTSMLDV